MSAEVLERLEADRMRAVADALAGWPGDGAGGHAEADTEFLVALCLPLADELRRYHAWTLRRAQAQPVAGMAAYRALRDGLRRVLAEGLRLLDGAAAAARQSGGDVARLADLEAAAPRTRAWADGVLAAWPDPDAGWPAFDAEGVRQAREGIARGEHGEDLADVLARIQAGGPLVKE